MGSFGECRGTVAPLLVVVIVVSCSCLVLSTEGQGLDGIGSIFTHANGSVLINSPANGSVLVNGMDLQAENAKLAARIVELEEDLQQKQVMYGDLISCFLPPGVTTVTGRVIIENCGDRLIHVNSFHHLESVGAGLVIHSNPQLVNVDGFSNLRFVGSLSIHNNPALTNVDGFSSLTVVAGSFTIWVNNALTNVDGFSSLKATTGHLSIDQNSMLTNVDGFTNLTTVGGYLNVLNNDALKNVNGLTGVTSVSGDFLRICHNAQVSSIPTIFATLSAGKVHASQCLQAGDTCC